MKNFNSYELDSIISEKEINIDKFSRDELLEMISNISIVKQYTDLFEQMSDQDIAEISKYVEFRGEFDVIPRTNNYEVVFPDRTTILPSEGEEFESIQLFHPIKLRVTPTGDPSAFRVAFEMDQKPFYAILLFEVF